MASKETLHAEKVRILTHESENLANIYVHVNFNKLHLFKKKTCQAFIIDCETGIDILTG